MIELLAEWTARFPIVSIEDGLGEEDWAALASADPPAGSHSADRRRLVRNSTRPHRPRRARRRRQRRTDQDQPEWHTYRNPGRRRRVERGRLRHDHLGAIGGNRGPLHRRPRGRRRRLARSRSARSAPPSAWPSTTSCCASKKKASPSPASPSFSSPNGGGGRRQGWRGPPLGDISPSRPPSPASPVLPPAGEEKVGD